jgi:formate hydrogenlyase transcriptional activator
MTSQDPYTYELRERDRSRMLLEITNLLVSTLDLDELLHRISAILKRTVPHDLMALALWDEGTQSLTIRSFNFGGDGFVPTGYPVPLRGTPGGLAFASRQTVLRHNVDLEEFDAPEMQRLRDIGLSSGCAVPLVVRDKAIGVVSLASLRESAFTPEDAAFMEAIAAQMAVAVDNAVAYTQIDALKDDLSRDRDRKQLLLEVTNALVSTLDLEELVRRVSDCLKRLVPHDYAGLTLWDESIGQLRVHAFDGDPGRQGLGTGFPLPLEGTPSGLAFTTRRTVLRDTLDVEEFHAPQIRRYIESGMRSGCCVPLLLRDKAIGTITIATRREGTFTEDDAGLLEEIAGQIAVAVDNALAYKEIGGLKNDLARDRDRVQLLLDITNALVSTLDLEVLLLRVSTCLKGVVAHDLANLALWDESIGRLRLHAFDAEAGRHGVERGSAFPVDGNPAGLAFTSRQTVLRQVVDLQEFHAPETRLAYEAGFRSGCWVPLVVRDNAIGVLSVASRRETAFDEDDAALLESIAGQVAVAVDNALAYREISGLKNDLAYDRDRVSLLLDITNALVSTLDLAELLRRVSTCLRRIVAHDFSQLALFDPTSGQLRIQAFDVVSGWKPGARTLADVAGHKPGFEFITDGFPLALGVTPSGRAFDSGRTVLLERFDLEEFSAPACRLAYEAGVRSWCAVPLVVRDRKLGAISVASFGEAAFTKEDAELLEAVAAQVAVSVENALSYREIGGLKNDLARDRDRVQLMLDTTNALVSTLDLEEVLHRISACIKGLVAHDFMSLSLWDEASGKLRVHTVDGAPGREFPEKGYLMPLEGTPAGLAFRTRSTVRRNTVDLEEFTAPELQRFVDAGLRSGCAVPLVVRDRVLGVVSLVSLREDSFSEADAELLESIAGQVAVAVENALAYREIAELKNLLASEKLYLEEEIRSEHNFAEIVGRSPSLRRVLQQIETVAPTDSVVLIQGETGTGKELVARAIHDLSARRERTLVKLNCAAIPTGLLESELFGHEKGAFTGAIAQRIGRFEVANKGTLLLDEVGDIPSELQPKLLRVLQEHEFERLGSSRTVRVDVRLVAATNADLAGMVAEKKFRSDLFYRLNVFPITVPPLRERVEDVPLLAAYFVQKHGLRLRKQVGAIPRDAIDAMCEYSWPGNVRELENFVERAMILTRGDELQAPLAELRRHAPVSASAGAAAPSASPEPARSLTLEDAERAHIEEVLRRTNGVVGGKGGAAEILGLPISTLRGRMKKLGLL